VPNTDAYFAWAVSSFVAVSPSESRAVPATQTYSSDLVSDTDNSDSLVRGSVDNSINILDIKKRHRAVIPPPEERDVVRKHIDTSSHMRAQSPLGQLYKPVVASKPETRGIRVNNTGLPPPPSSGVPVISRMKRYTFNSGGMYNIIMVIVYLSSCQSVLSFVPISSYTAWFFLVDVSGKPRM